MTRQNPDKPEFVEESKISRPDAQDLREIALVMYDHNLGIPYWDHTEGKMKYKLEIEREYYVFDPETKELRPKTPPQS